MGRRFALLPLLILAANLGRPCFAQTPNSIVALRLTEYQQTSATNETISGYDFYTLVSFPTPPSTSTSVALKTPKGTTVNLTREDDGSFQFSTRDVTASAIKAAYPDGNYTISVSGGTANSTTTITIATPSDTAPVLIANFNDLQAFPSATPTITWAHIPGAENTDYIAFGITQADGTRVTTRQPDTAYYDSFTTSSLPIGVPLRANLTFAKFGLVQPTNNAETYFATGAGFDLAFPLFCTAPAAVITQQPVDVAVAGGATAQLSVQATGGGAISYQWFHDGAAVAGHTTSVLTLPIARPSDAGTYTVKVTNVGGTVTSAPARLSVGPALQVSAFAGGNGAGATDGTGAAATFNRPSAIAVDGKGNLYVVDANGTTIRKIAPDATVTTLARGFNAIEGIATDDAGTVYVADYVDYASSVVNKVAADGTVTVLARSPVSDRLNPAAAFGRFGGIAVTRAGDVFVTDSTYMLVRRIASDGTASIFAGRYGAHQDIDGVGTDAGFTYPVQIDAAPDGMLYVLDGSTGRLRQITPAGVVSTIEPYLRALSWIDPSGTLYTSNTSGALTMITKDGVSHAIAGGNTTTGAPPVGFGAEIAARGFDAVVIDPTGTFYLVDPDNNAIRKGVLVAGSADPGITLVAQPRSVTVATGSSVAISVRASGPGLSYQWRRDGKILPGTSATYTTLFVPNAQPADAGTYSCLVTNPAGGMESAAASIGVVNTTNPGRIFNLSIRTTAGTGAQTLIVGMAINGAGTGNKPILVRGVGSTLGHFDLAGVLSDPQLTVYRGTTAIGTDDNWTSDLIPTFNAVGAFGLAPDSADAAMQIALPAATYTVQITGKGDTGLALAEIYDVDQSPTLRLVNVSARSQVGTGDNVLIAGFVITGDTAKTVLVRGVGPTLEQYGVQNPYFLADPRLDLYSGQTVLASNDDWGNDPVLYNAFQSVGAFTLFGDTKDAALLITLEPGLYSAKVSGAHNGAGVGLIEVYEIP